MKIGVNYLQNVVNWDEKHTTIIETAAVSYAMVQEKRKEKVKLKDKV